MKFIKFPIVPLLFSLIFGILTQHFCNLNLNSIVIALIFSSIGFVFAYFLNTKKKYQSHFFEIFVLIISFVFGMFSSYLHKETNSKNHFSYFLSEKNNVQGIISEKLKSTVYYDKFILKTSSVNDQNCIGKIILYVPKKASKIIEVGNAIKVFETPTLLQNSFNPHQFDYAKYLQNQNIFHELKFKETDKLEVYNAANFYHYINVVKSKLLKSYQIDSFKKDNYNLLMALLFGEKTELSKELSNSYTQAGIIHFSDFRFAYCFNLRNCTLANQTFTTRKKRKNLYLFNFLKCVMVLCHFSWFFGFNCSSSRYVFNHCFGENFKPTI